MRSFDPTSLFRLPRLDGATAITLGVAFLARAQAPDVPAPCKEAARDLREAHEVLFEAVSRATFESKRAGAAALKTAAAQLSNAWVTLHGLAVSWNRMPEGAERDRAAELLRRLFPKGVSFVRKRFDHLLPESKGRIVAIEAEGFVKHVRAIGATKVLELVRSAHDAYERAFIARGGDRPAPGRMTLAAALTCFRKALSAYVLQAAALHRKSDPEGCELSRRLLQPFTLIKVRYKRREKAKEVTGAGDATQAIEATSSKAAPGASTIAPPRSGAGVPRSATPIEREEASASTPRPTVEEETRAGSPPRASPRA